MHLHNRGNRRDAIDGRNATRFPRLTLIVEGYATASANVDDTLDQIGKEIEVAMSGDITLNDLAQDSYLSSVEITLSGDGSTGIGKITHSYTVVYQNAENAPDAAL